MSEKLGKLVKDAREEKGLTQTELAAQVEGLSASEVGRIERGEKEPSREVIRRMAKALGVTQKSLLEACSGNTSASSAGGSGKAASGKTASGKKASGKASSAKKPASAKTSSASLTLTATEKKLVQLYRKADSGTKKAALNLLSGEGNAVEIIGAMLAGRADVSNMASGLFETLLSGKTAARSADIPGEEQ